jgi:hypothetical protein
MCAARHPGEWPPRYPQSGVQLQALSFIGMFTTHPFPYVAPAMEQFDAAVLAGGQKTNDLDVHEGHAFEVQRDRRVLAIDLLLQFIEILGLQPAA